MKQLIFFGIMLLVGSCSTQRMDFSKRIPVFESNISPAENFAPEESFTCQSILKPVEEKELTFEFAPGNIITESDNPITRFEPIWRPIKISLKTDEQKHNECACFGKSLKMTGAVLMVAGGITLFSWTTLGLAFIIIGAVALITGIIIVRSWLK